MGKGHSQDSSDVNFFDTQRNDVQAGPNRFQQDAYVDYQCPQRGDNHRTTGRDGYVTIRDGANIIYAEAGSTVIINQGGDGRMGRGQGSWIPQDYSDTYRQVQESRQAQWVQENRGRLAQPYYGDDCPRQYRPVSGGDYEVEPRYRHSSGGDQVGRFFGRLAEGLLTGVAVGAGARLVGGGHMFGRGFVPGFVTGSVLGPREWGGYSSGYDSYGGDGYYYAMEQRRLAERQRYGYINRGWG
ncbi:MAG: hypothetical protein JSS86_07170 [Cyanobacteria bacterium SZAS LIN-2]|nr:hypothetical protein [Cyanobacteria bacterium SZAS LIN-2]